MVQTCAIVEWSLFKVGASITDFTPTPRRRLFILLKELDPLVFYGSTETILVNVTALLAS